MKWKLGSKDIDEIITVVEKMEKMFFKSKIIFLRLLSAEVNDGSEIIDSCNKVYEILDCHFVDTAIYINPT